MMRKGLILLGILWLAFSSEVYAQDEEKGTGLDAKREEIITKLEKTKISLDFKEAKLADIVDLIRELTELNILSDERTNEKLKNIGEEKKGEGDKFTIKLKEVSLKVILKFLLEPKGLALTYKEGVLVIVPQEVLEAQTTVKMYDVRDLLFKIQDFPGPHMALDTVASAARKPDIVIILPEEEGSKPTMTSEELINTIKTTIGENKWKNDKNTSI